MKTLVMFPGQGSQYKGMAKDLYESSPQSKLLLDEIFNIVDFDLKEIMFNDESQLNQTQYTQPALFAHSLAVLAATNIKADVVLGHSLGEIPALVHASVISLEDGVKIVAKRGELMSHAKEGAMSAVIGLDYDVVKRVCDQLNSNESKVTPANINAPDQIVVSGDKNLMEQFINDVKEAGARRVMPLNVSGAFHSYLMEDSQKEFKTFLNKIPFNDAKIPVIQNVSAQPETNGEKIKQQLIEQITHPVRFVECIESAKALSIDKAIEVGPKKVLCGLLRKIDKSIDSAHIDTMTDVKEYLNE